MVRLNPRPVSPAPSTLPRESVNEVNWVYPTPDMVWETGFKAINVDAEPLMKFASKFGVAYPKRLVSTVKLGVGAAVAGNVKPAVTTTAATATVLMTFFM